MEFSKIEKISILNLAVTMAYIDGKMTESEQNALFIPTKTFGDTEADFKALMVEAQKIKATNSVAVVAQMNDEKKMYAAAYLGTIVAADDHVDNAELKLWKLITNICELPTMTATAATEIIRISQL